MATSCKEKTKREEKQMKKPYTRPELKSLGQLRMVTKHSGAVITSGAPSSSTGHPYTGGAFITSD